MVLRSGTIVFNCHSFINRIQTCFFTLATTILPIQKPTAMFHVSIQSKLHFGYVLLLLHTSTTVKLASMLAMSILISGMIPYTHGLHVLWDGVLMSPQVCLAQLVLGTGPGNLLVVQVWTAKMGRFGSIPVQTPDMLPLGGPVLDPYLSTLGMCWLWLDLLVPIYGSAFWVSLFIGKFRSTTVIHEILTFIPHWLCSMY